MAVIDEVEGVFLRCVERADGMVILGAHHIEGEKKPGLAVPGRA
ncbi:hypothetical protein [Hydrogenophaga laconesensis]|uniref:Uncharacterized protein n=1 Tax=Hydrogenophaga laconesensis TaxID=1805971 RepID=A0ABU1VA90_9BURK|nr:hypothetical protein [Hydrogenophaga laconesensis]MDR7094386.1 hypothetical protein [Hydrogenophaga laconesensis]